MKKNNGLFYWLLLIAILLIAFSCTKQEITPTCGTIIQMKKVYNNTSEWKYLRTEVVKDFGYQCGEFFQTAYKQRFDTTEICLLEPVKVYWKINY